MIVTGHTNPVLCALAVLKAGGLEVDEESFRHAADFSMLHQGEGGFAFTDTTTLLAGLHLLCRESGIGMLISSDRGVLRCLLSDPLENQAA